MSSSCNVNTTNATKRRGGGTAWRDHRCRTDTDDDDDTVMESWRIETNIIICRIECYTSRSLFLYMDRVWFSWMNVYPSSVLPVALHIYIYIYIKSTIAKWILNFVYPACCLLLLLLILRPSVIPSMWWRHVENRLPRMADGRKADNRNKRFAKSSRYNPNKI